MGRNAYMCVCVCVFLFVHKKIKQETSSYLFENIVLCVCNNYTKNRVHQTHAKNVLSGSAIFLYNFRIVFSGRFRNPECLSVFLLNHGR